MDYSSVIMDMRQDLSDIGHGQDFSLLAEQFEGLKEGTVTWIPYTVDLRKSPNPDYHLGENGVPPIPHFLLEEGDITIGNYITKRPLETRVSGIETLNGDPSLPSHVFLRLDGINPPIDVLAPPERDGNGHKPMEYFGIRIDDSRFMVQLRQEGLAVLTEHYHVSRDPMSRRSTPYGEAVTPWIWGDLLVRHR